MRPLALTLLAACAVDADPAALPADQTMPPIAMTLEVDHAPLRGEPMTVTITGAPANKVVYLVAGTNLTNPGLCPPILAPDCIDVANPYVMLGRNRADANGEITYTITVPTNVAAPAIELQAASINGPDHYISNSEILPLADAPPLTPIPVIKANAPAGALVRAEGIVTAVRSNGFAMQTNAAPIENMGMWVYTGAGVEPAVGDVVRVTGDFTLFDNNGTETSPALTLAEINVQDSDHGFWTLQGTAPLPLPFLLTMFDVQDPAVLEGFESMLVELSDPFVPLTVATDYLAPGAFNEFFVEGSGGQQFEVDNEFVNLGALLGTLTIGDTFDAVTGIMFYSFDEYKVAPRSLNDAINYIDN